MARPMGPVRMRKPNYITLSIGAALCLFILYFLARPGPSSSLDYPTSRAPIHKPAAKSNLIGERPPVRRLNLNQVTITSDPLNNREVILILTPMARFYQEYWDNLVGLDYPHDLINLGFILPKTKEGNAATTALQAAIAKVQQGPTKDRFRSITIEREDGEAPLTSQEESERHKMENQKARRAAMSLARNSLLFTTLGIETSWVLWLDADIVESPPTLIQDLASHNKDIIVPNCFQKYINSETNELAERPYDFNSWQDSKIALDLAEKMSEDEILLEGYSEMATYRTLMAFLDNPRKDERYEIELDGVGGTALMVKANVHRDGAMFPPFPFYHLIETEGFAKMARRLGYQPIGLPNYRVYHYNE